MTAERDTEQAGVAVEERVTPETGEHDETVADAAHDNDNDGDNARPTARWWRWPTLLASLGLLAAALAAAGVWLFLQVHEQRATADDRTQAVAAARQKVLDLLTLSQTNAKEDVARVLQGTTGEFKDQFSRQTAAWEQVLTQGKVDSSGQIQEAGAASLNGDAAEVMVAASATVKNTQSPAGEARQYRMKVTVQRVASQWLVSKLEFVP